MSLIRWRPFAEMDDLFDLIVKKNGSDFAADIFEDEKSVTLKIHLPGIDPDKIDIMVENHHVHIKGSREEEHEVQDRHYYHKEIRCGSFERRIELPCPVNDETTKAELANGVLTVVFQKKNQTVESKKRINIVKK